MSELKHLLEAAAAAQRSTSPSTARLTAQLRELNARLQGNELQVAVLGQFKRGKSTLINALLGISLLPTGIVPVTAIPTVIRPGGSWQLEVRFKNDQPAIVERDPSRFRDCLTRYVSETSNPKNKLHVEAVIIEGPCALLADGIVLIDTPGVGSTLHHNTQAAREALKSADVAIFVTSPDPPLTEVEQTYLAEIRQVAPRIYLVFNKFDTLIANDRATALAFLMTAINGAKPDAGDIRVFPLSARDALAASEQADAKLLADSGLIALRDALTDELAREKQSIAEEAARRRGILLLNNMLFETELELRALQLPLEELSTRLAVFSQAIGGYRREAVSIGDHAEADQKGLIRQLEADSQTLWTGATRDCLKAAGNLFETHRGDLTKVRAEIGKLIADRFEVEAKYLADRYKSALRDSMGALQQRAYDLNREVRAAAARLMDVPAIEPLHDEAISMKREAYWVAPEAPLSLSALAASGLQQLLPFAVRKRIELRRIAEEVERAVLRNVSQLEWALRQNIQDAYRAFQLSLTEQLDQAIASTQAVMALADERRRENEVKAAHMIDELHRSIDRLKGYLSRLESGPDLGHTGELA